MRKGKHWCDLLLLFSRDDYYPFLTPTLYLLLHTRNHGIAKSRIVDRSRTAALCFTDSKSLSWRVCCRSHHSTPCFKLSVLNTKGTTRSGARFGCIKENSFSARTTNLNLYANKPNKAKCLNFIFCLWC